MPRFRDILYGPIDIPSYLMRFLRLPEFVRLRGVRLSNVDSFEFKDFNAPTRWEHGVGVAALALHCADHRSRIEGRELSERDRLHLVLASLLHDVATPPFAHTAEYVLKDFGHELETHNIVSGSISGDAFPDLTVFQAELPSFRGECKILSRERNTQVDPDEIARMVIGQGDLGYLISGTLDLDNADNVTRACMYLGMEVDRRLPMRLAEWLAGQYGPSVGLDKTNNPDVRLWREYRSRLYTAFFESSAEELGRQAFLQHLMRRSLREGMPRRILIWNTDDGLLRDMAAMGGPQSRRDHVSLSDLVRRYRLMDPTTEVLKIPIWDDEVFRALKSPQAATWIENRLTSPDLEVFVIVSARRFRRDLETLFPVSSTPPIGVLQVYKLGEPLKHREQLPDWIKPRMPSELEGPELRSAFGELIAGEIPTWVRERAWLSASTEEQGETKRVLESIGDWNFRLSRNENFHAYPSTFVHAIPASLINALGIKGELVVDPFGGTGQTALEVLKYGGKAVSSDINSIATLIARSRFTYLDAGQRELLRGLSEWEVGTVESGDPPEFPLRDKWYDPKTLKELSLVRSFVEQCGDPALRQFMRACFSAVLTSATGRKGEQHGFFADNTPLGSKQESPPYQPAIRDFVRRLHRNVRLVERLYSFIEKADREPSAELGRISVMRRDAREATPEDYGIEPNSAAAIITSPPYLCTTDYSLGLRLSYYWLHERALQADYAAEIGARRQRFAPTRALESYVRNVGMFARRAAAIVRPGGYLAMVIGASEAKAFEGKDVMGAVDRMCAYSDFELVWSQVRPIYWHRNHGYQRVKQERIAVYRLRH
jgi:hypothetical protein